MAEGRVLDRSFLFLILLLLVFAGMVFYILNEIWIDPYTEKRKETYEITHGFIVYDEGRPVLTELLFLHPVTKRGALYYIPSNTGTIIESVDRMDRIDLLFDPENPQVYLDKIDRMLGTDTEFFFSIELEDFATLVDWMGGLETFIPQPVWQEDGEEYRIFPSGSILLDGGKIGSYLKYRLPEEGLEEPVSRKISVTETFLQKLAGQKAALENPEYMRFIYSRFSTNLDEESFLSFIDLLSEVQVDRMITQRVMGKERQVESQRLLFPLYEERLLKEMLAQIIENLGNPDVAEESGLTISIEIQNGTTINGLASRTAQLYQSYGFKIASVKNADRQDYENTLILDKKENPVSAQRVANLIRCERIFEDRDSTTDDTVDVILIIGKDFDGRYVK